jgi:hypothetical protein
MTREYEVRDPDIEQRLRDIGGRLGAALEGSTYGFALLLCGKEGTAAEHNAFYISNFDRGDMLKLLQEFINRERTKRG